MWIEIQDEHYSKLVKISNMKKEYIGFVAAELLEDAIESVDLGELKQSLRRR